MHSVLSRFEVRPAGLRDARAIAEIHIQSQRSASEGFLPPEVLKSFSQEKRQARWREAIEFCEPQLLVATLEQRVVGFVAFDRSRDKGTPSTMGEIWAMYAEPSLWGQGLGLALWDAARDGLQQEGCTHVSAWLPLRGERALRFFELAGFKRELNSAKTSDAGSARVEEIRLKRSLQND